MSNKKKERIYIDWEADDEYGNPVYGVIFSFNGREVEGQIHLSTNRAHLILNGSFWDKRYPEIAFDEKIIKREAPITHGLTIEEVLAALKMIPK